ncbi:MAG: helix-turn-helix transcriptional regulator, partial [Lachnospiraceae bacterium]|nr:helix-turn-helix transcriptional regulator [Lachnospiraceae bacterium]
SFGSIYPSLSAMTREGLVEKLEDSEKTGGREKINYAITTQGKAALRTWLEDSRAVNDMKYETLLKLFFGGVAEPQVSINNINAFESEVRESLNILKFYQSNLSKVLDNPDHIYYYLTVSFGVETYEGYLRWCAMAKEMLEKENKKQSCHREKGAL